MKIKCGRVGRRPGCGFITSYRVSNMRQWRDKYKAATRTLSWRNFSQLVQTTCRLYFYSVTHDTVVASRMVQHRHSEMLRAASRPMSRFHGAPPRFNCASSTIPRHQGRHLLSASYLYSWAYSLTLLSRYSSSVEKTQG